MIPLLIHLNYLDSIPFEKYHIIHSYFSIIKVIIMILPK